MSTLTQTKPCVTNTASSAYFNLYSGTWTYDFSSSIPSNAVISSITFSSSMMYIGANSTTGSYAIRVCSSTSDTTGSVASSYITLTASSSNTYFSSTKWYLSSSYFDNFKNGSVVIRLYRSGSSSQTSKIYYGGTLNNTSKGYLVCTVTYSVPSISSPGTPTIVQSSTTGTYTASWTAASLSDTTGTITYKVMEYNTDAGTVTTAGSTTSTSLSSLSIPAYGSSVKIYIAASCSSLSSTSSYATPTFYYPSINAPTIDTSSSTTQGESLTLYWNAATLNYTSATIYYYIYIDDNFQTSTTSTQITIEESTFEDLSSDEHTIKIYAYATNLTHTGTGVPTTLGVYSTNTLTFTYDGKKTIGYYNGSSWQPCIVNYYNGSTWIECIPYYYNGTSWQEIKTN